MKNRNRQAALAASRRARHAVALCYRGESGSVEDLAGEANQAGIGLSHWWRCRWHRPAAAAKLEAQLAQPLIFEYRPGAGATIAADYVARAAPDGYTLHLLDSGVLTILPNARN